MVTACKCVERLCTGIVSCRIVSYCIVLYCISCDIDRHIDGVSGVSCVLFHPILSYPTLFHSIPFHSDHLREYCNRIFCISMVFVTELYTKVLYRAVHRTYSKPVIQMSDRSQVRWNFHPSRSRTARSISEFNRIFHHSRCFSTSNPAAAAAYSTALRRFFKP